MGATTEKKETQAAGGQAAAAPAKAEAPGAQPVKNPQQEYLQQVQRGAGGEGGPEAGKEGGGDKGGDKGASTGLANYEATLGKFLGGKLYGAVSDAVTLDKVQGYAKSALDGAIDALVAQIAEVSGPQFDAKAVQVFDQALTQALSPYVDAFMEGPGQDLTQNLQEWVDASPRAVAALAILAAVGYVAANGLIPTLKAKYKIAPGLEASVEAKLGRFQSISLEQIKGQIEARKEFDNAHVKAKLEFVHNKEKGDSLRGEIRFQAPDGRWVVGIGATKDQTGESLDGFLTRNWPKENLALELRGRMHKELGSEVMIGLKWKF